MNNGKSQNNNMKKPTLDLYSAIQQAYDYYNAELFNSQLPQCLITLQRQAKAMGYFSPKRFVNSSDKSIVDELAINPSYIPSYPLTELMQTLVHEMCHLWQFHFGKPSRSCYHNKEWADKMVDVGLMPSTTGREGGKKTGQNVSDYAIKNGIFQKKTLDFFLNGFAFEWLERTAKPTTTQTQATVMQIWGEALESLGNKQEEAQQIIFAVEGVLGVGGDENEPLISVSTQKNNTRLKYSCGCSNIWGKTNLDIMCNSCGNDFQVTE